MDIRKLDGSEYGGSFPLRRLQKCVPSLPTEFDVIARRKNQCILQSKMSWSRSNIRRAETWRQSHAFYSSNYGGHDFGDDGNSLFLWRFLPTGPILPTMTAALLFSFVICSLARYRPNVLASVEDSKLFLLFDVFCQEADGFLIPTFRNLLFGRSLQIAGSGYT